MINIDKLRSGNFLKENKKLSSIHKLKGGHANNKHKSKSHPKKKKTHAKAKRPHSIKQSNKVNEMKPYKHAESDAVQQNVQLIDNTQPLPYDNNENVYEQNPIQPQTYNNDLNYDGQMMDQQQQQPEQQQQDVYVPNPQLES